METQENNPYESPKQADSVAAKPSVMLWAVVTVLASASAAGLMGAVIGGALGVFLPGYYRSVFSGGTTPGFDPVAVGIGLGLSQGVIFGGIVGVALVGLYLHHQRKASSR